MNFNITTQNSVDFMTTKFTKEYHVLKEDNIDSLNSKINKILCDTAQIIAGNEPSKRTSKLWDATRILIKEWSETSIYDSRYNDIF